MPRYTDLVGQRFGKLTVVACTPQRQNQYRVWRCRCDCGGEILVNTRHLQRGTVTDCGCVRQPSPHGGARAEDLTGRRFGRLTVVQRVANRGSRTCWLCRCDCGGSRTATARDLKAGKVTSCGCGRALAHPGEDITGQRFGRLVALRPTLGRDSRGSVLWHCRCDCGSELDVSHNDLVQGNYRSCGCLKREVQQSIKDKLHHIDGTCVEWLEKRKHRSDNTSGFRGVSLNRDGGFRVGIGFKGKRYYLGTYHNYDQAVAARLAAEDTLHNAFVQAYHRWEALYGALPESQRCPLVFEVQRRNGDFQVVTNLPSPGGKTAGP